MDKTKYRIIRKKGKKIDRKKLIICLVGIAVLVAVTLGLADRRGNADEFSMSYVNAEEIPQFMQFTYYDREEWRERLGLRFTGRLTYQKLEELLELLEIKDYITYETNASKKQVEREVWNQIYEQITELLDMDEKVEKKKLLILEKQDEMIVTQEGTYAYAGEGLKSYQSYEAYVKDDVLLGIAAKTDDELPVENVFVTSMTDTLNFMFEHRTFAVPLHAEGTITDTVCDVWFGDGEIIRIDKKEDIIEGRLLMMDSERIEIEGYGPIARAGKLPVYQTYGDRVQKNISDIVIGNMKISYIVADKCVSAVLLKEPPEITTVRVLLLNDQNGVGMPDICVSSESDYTVTFDKKEQSISAGTVTKASDYLEENSKQSLKLEPAGDGGTLYLCGEDGSKTSLSYNGSMEIRKYDEGYVAVSVLSLEQYLYSVVPSEVPYDYPEEALKAQAVCARSYASIQMLKGAYAKYGAHMDDSVNYQVYNKQERNERTTKAVDDTCGLVLAQGENVLEAYYYSTSFGHSGSYESWNLENDGSYDYLTGTWLKDEALDLDLSDEEVFSDYIKNADEACYDSFSKYFRWRIEIDVTDLSYLVKEKIDARKEVQPKNIKITVRDEETEETQEAENTAMLGILESVMISGRNKCGGIGKMTFLFENGRVEILDEYSMRIALGVAMKRVVLGDESETDGLSILPSSYFSMEALGDGKYVLYGGGYGHGIGLSQNGAKGMAEKGYTYKDILEKFYNKIELLDIYSMEQK